MDVTGETELVNGCINGDRKYQELLYLKYCRKMMGVCYRYSRNREEAEDLLQDSFIKVFSRLKQFRHEGSLEGWIRRIVLTTIFDSFRKKTIMTVLSDYEHEELSDPAEFMSGFDFNQLVEAIRELSPGYRAVFNMFAIEGYTHKEIGAALGISPGTSKSQYAAARRVLQKKLKKELINQTKVRTKS
jgi:RNA polymerase sigma factor (sigma-70 family)